MDVGKNKEDGCSFDKRSYLSKKANEIYKEINLTKDSILNELVSEYSILKKAFKEYPNLQHDLENRHIVYNETLDTIDKLEREGQIFVIRPSKPIACAMIEKDPNHLQEIYDIGRRDALNSLEELKKYL
mgnify:CR=1 FL=1